MIHHQLSPTIIDHHQLSSSIIKHHRSSLAIFRYVHVSCYVMAHDGWCSWLIIESCGCCLIMGSWHVTPPCWATRGNDVPGKRRKSKAWLRGRGDGEEHVRWVGFIKVETNWLPPFLHTQDIIVVQNLHCLVNLSKPADWNRNNGITFSCKKMFVPGVACAKFGPNYFQHMQK